MISISGNMIELDPFVSEHSFDAMDKKILGILSKSSEIYWFDYENQLIFELNYRKNIIKASQELYRSRFSFKIFRKSICNETFWRRTDEGGFLLKSDVTPASAIRDIYVHSSKYGTECSTAIVIVFYRGLVETIPDELFNKLFPDIYLMNWQHLDKNLGVSSLRNVKDYLPGDCRYFKNPDVNPLTPEWQGENAIDLGNGTYYGHGIGIKSGDAIIRALNDQRKEGSEVSAYLMNSVTRPDFKRLADKYDSFVSP